MNTEELRNEISKSITTAKIAKDYFQEAFVELQESIVEEISIAMANIVDKNIDKAYSRLHNLKDELVADIKISKEKEPR